MTTARAGVLDLLEPGDLRLGQVMIKRVAVVKQQLGWLVGVEFNAPLDTV